MVASPLESLRVQLQNELSTPRFRLYTNVDTIGVEIGAATKNIIAIAAGVADGLGLGSNAVAALVTRGLAEITRLAVACGGRRETLSGLAGLGDLILTSYGNLSRNRTVGIALGQGRKIEEIIGGMRSVAEGVKTTESAVALARTTECRNADRGKNVCRALRRPESAGCDQRSDGTKAEGRIVEFITLFGKPEEKKPTVLEKIKAAVKRTQENLNEGFKLVEGKKDIDPEMLEELEGVMVSADMGIVTTTEMLNAIRDQMSRKTLQDPQQLRSAVKDELRKILRVNTAPPKAGRRRRTVCHPDGGRQWRRQNDDDRKTRQPIQERWEESHALRRRYVSRGGERTTGDLGEAVGCADCEAAGRGGSFRRAVRRIAIGEIQEDRLRHRRYCRTAPHETQSDDGTGKDDAHCQSAKCPARRTKCCWSWMRRPVRTD